MLTENLVIASESYELCFFFYVAFSKTQLLAPTDSENSSVIVPSFPPAVLRLRHFESRISNMSNKFFQVKPLVCQPSPRLTRTTQALRRQNIVPNYKGETRFFFVAVVFLWMHTHRGCIRTVGPFEIFLKLPVQLSRSELQTGASVFCP